MILLGFNNGRAGRMAAFATQWAAEPQPVRRAAWGPCLGGRRRALLAVRRAAAAGCGGFPAGASRPLFAVCASFPADRVRGHAPPGARRAGRALEDVLKVLTDLARTREDTRGHGVENIARTSLVVSRGHLLARPAGFKLVTGCLEVQGNASGMVLDVGIY